MHPHPDEIVAYGATKLARGLLVGDIDILINEVNPLTLAASVQFSETLGFSNKRFHDPDVKLVMSPIIARNRTIPLEEERVYATTKDN